MNLLENHMGIITEIKEIISKKYNVELNSVDIKQNENIENYILRFQIVFFNKYLNPMKSSHLNFEIYHDSPHLICFETTTGLRKFDKSNRYSGLIDELVKSMSKLV